MSSIAPENPPQTAPQPSLNGDHPQPQESPLRQRSAKRAHIGEGHIDTRPLEAVPNRRLTDDSNDEDEAVQEENRVSRPFPQNHRTYAQVLLPDRSQEPNPELTPEVTAPRPVPIQPITINSNVTVVEEEETDDERSDMILSTPPPVPRTPDKRSRQNVRGIPGNPRDLSSPTPPLSEPREPDEAYKAPDPHKWVSRGPYYANLNPHCQRTRSGPLPIHPEAVPAHTNTEFPKIFLTHTDQMAGYTPSQIQNFTENPDKYTAVMFHGAGQDHFATHNTKIPIFLSDFIKGVKMPNEPEDDNNFHIISPASPRGAPKDFRKFSPPYVTFIAGLSKAKKDFLLYEQTFSLSEEVALHFMLVSPVGNNSWYIANFTAGFLNPGEKERLETLATIVSDCWKDRAFCAATDRLYTISGGPSNDPDAVLKRAVATTSTWDLTILRQGVTPNSDPDDPAHENAQFIFQLSGSPLSANPDEHEKWCQIIRNKIYTVYGDTIVKSAKQTVGCIWCKAEDHFSHACLFNFTEGWYGPGRPRDEEPDTTKKVQDSVNDSDLNPQDWAAFATRGHGRGRGNSRGRGNGRGRGRGYGNRYRRAGDAGEAPGSTVGQSFADHTSPVFGNGLGIDLRDLTGAASQTDPDEEQKSLPSTAMDVPTSSTGDGTSLSSPLSQDDELQNAVRTRNVFAEQTHLLGGLSWNDSCMLSDIDITNGDHLNEVRETMRRIDALLNEATQNPQHPLPTGTENTGTTLNVGDPDPPDITQQNSSGSVPKQRGNCRARRQNTKTNVRAAIWVASLNMRGYSSQGTTSPQGKWDHVNQLIKEKHIGALALQETHMSEERRRLLEKRYNQRIQIFATAGPEHASSKRGVAIVLNKNKADVSDVKQYVIVPGRALLIRTNWYKQGKINILAIYAPNVSGANGKDNAAFWEQIQEYYEHNPRTPKLDIVLGDMNLVENGMIDRMPAHDDPEEAIDALDDLKLKFHLKDSWRDTYPDTKAFTFPQNRPGSQSRIDRIYVTEKLLPLMREWKIEATGVPGADHKLISVQVSSEEAPYVGKGRWKLPSHIIKDKHLQGYIHERGLKAQTENDNLAERTPSHNPQTIWHKYKVDILDAARRREKIVVPHYVRQKREAETELERVLNDDTLFDEERLLRVNELQEQIETIERRQHLNARKDLSVKHRLEGEIPSRYWSNINKEKKPRDMIYALQKPDPTPDAENTTPEEHHKKCKKIATVYNPV
ncbi:hypothetical protein D9758_017941 [Tetrapyrgos nigripes]|uniref:Endonuclease/exonuclease/phosphatase domain-containing protein n=1 Tax=Tetrapyrgos nigripes TaxID=182062 RepID=A0A8H5F9A3_9AGAR|nr:hypothetical protein D9758_017941 [Tetrapyrgos nigripes]